MGDAAQLQEVSMFGWAIAFLVIAIIAGVLGFGGVAGTAFSAAKIVFIVALIAFLISGVLGYTRRGMPSARPSLSAGSRSH
jgi:uncharacterized membrane protein YtjA (UPF0391 family)